MIYLVGMEFCPVADPGFPVGGHAPVRGGCGPPTQVLFGENVCENERIGSHGGWCAPGTPPRSANAALLEVDCEPYFHTNTWNICDSIPGFVNKVGRV